MVKEMTAPMSEWNAALVINVETDVLGSKRCEDMGKE
jgi:hypothetical protein